MRVGLAEVSIREQIGLLAYSPLASQDTLSGKYRNKQMPKNSRIALDFLHFGQDIDKPNTHESCRSLF